MKKYLSIFLICIILSCNTLPVFADNLFTRTWNNISEWTTDMVYSINHTIDNLVDYSTNHLQNLVPHNNSISVLSPSNNYYGDVVRNDNRSYTYDNDTYNLSTSYYYGGDTNYTNYNLTNNNNYYTYTTNNNNYTYDTSYYYQDTNYYYATYNEVTNVTIIQMPKTNPNQISVYKHYFQTASGSNSYNLLPSDIYGVYTNQTVYNYSQETDSSVLALFRLDGNYVNEVDSDISLYYDGQTFVNGKFTSGLQLNGETKLTILADSLPSQYSVRFWFYNAIPNYNDIPNNAWVCCDYVYDNGEVYCWFNGIQKTYSTQDYTEGIWKDGVSQFGKSADTVNFTLANSFPRVTSFSQTSNNTYFRAYSLYGEVYYGNGTMSVPSGTSYYHSEPTFSSDSIIFGHTNSSGNDLKSGYNYTNTNKYTTSKVYGYIYETSYNANWGNYNNPSVTVDQLDWTGLLHSDTSGFNVNQYYHGYQVYVNRSTVTPTKYKNSYTSSDNFIDMSNCIIDDIVIYDGIQWLNGFNHINSIPTDPTPYGFIWSAPTGTFNVGDIAIKSSIPVYRVRVGGAKYSPSAYGDLFITLDENYYATSCEIFDGRTWINIDFGVWNGSSFISGWNYDFKNGFMSPPVIEDEEDEPSSSSPPYSDDDFSLLATLGYFFVWIGTLINFLPLIPVWIKTFLGGAFVFVGTALIYKAKKG